MKRCIDCHKIIWFWQRNVSGGLYHYKCTLLPALKDSFDDEDRAILEGYASDEDSHLEEKK